MQVPWAEQLAGHVAASHARPEYGASHTQVALTWCVSTRHHPRAPHDGVPRQVGRSHALPDQPGRHWHRPLFAHIPCVAPPHSFAEESAGQRRVEQSSPFHPAWHAHTPLSPMHVPCAEQRFGQVGRSHRGPSQPVAHWHVACVGPSKAEKRLRGWSKCGGWSADAFGVRKSDRAEVMVAAAARAANGPMHAPWPEQLDAQRYTEQSAPPKPGKHEHRPSPMQMPRPAQLLGQRTCEQSSPAKPSAHSHVPSTHIPCGEWQSKGHERAQYRPRAVASKPASQWHEPSTHLPCGPHTPPAAPSAAGLHASRSHFSPRHPSSHTHVPASHLPCAPHFDAEQSVGSGA